MGPDLRRLPVSQAILAAQPAVQSLLSLLFPRLFSTLSFLVPRISHALVLLSVFKDRLSVSVQSSAISGNAVVRKTTNSNVVFRLFSSLLHSLRSFCFYILSVAGTTPTPSSPPKAYYTLFIGPTLLRKQRKGSIVWHVWPPSFFFCILCSLFHCPF